MATPFQLYAEPTTLKPTSATLIPTSAAPPFVPFKKKHTLEMRKEEARRIRHKYPDRYPVICEKHRRSALANLPKSKYLIPCDLTVGQFIYVIRRAIQLEPDKAIFLTVGGRIPVTTERISDTYEKWADEDGFLYIQYTSENTFGV